MPKDCRQCGYFQRNEIYVEDSQTTEIYALCLHKRARIEHLGETYIHLGQSPRIKDVSHVSCFDMRRNWFRCGPWGLHFVQKEREGDPDRLAAMNAHVDEPHAKCAS